MIYVRADVKDLFAAERSVADFLRIDGEVVKHVVRTRRTSRFRRGGRTFYMKTHWGIGWFEVIKNLAMFRLPVTGARNEFRAIRAVHEIGLDTMEIAAFGEDGTDPATLKSFLIQTGSQRVESLFLSKRNRVYHIRVNSVLML